MTTHILRRNNMAEQLVKFKNGKYAIRRKCWLSKWEYKSRLSEYWWVSAEKVKSYCMCDTEEEAMSLSSCLPAVEEVKDISCKD